MAAYSRYNRMKSAVGIWFGRLKGLKDVVDFSLVEATRDTSIVII